MPPGTGWHLFRPTGGERAAAPSPPHSSCSNKTLASWVEECILAVLALEGCPPLLSIPPPLEQRVEGLPLAEG